MLQLLDNRVVFPVSSIFPKGASFHIDQMPQLLNTFNHSVDTETAKQRVSLWIESGFEAEMMEPLLHAVIVTFGGGYRIWGRSSTHFIDNQRDYNLILKQAYVLASRLDFGCLKEIKKIKGIGDTYATKFVRFFNDNFPVLDSRIREAGDYGCSDEQYKHYHHFCAILARATSMSLADVESCIFCFIQVSTSNKKIWTQHHQLKRELFVQ